MNASRLTANEIKELLNLQPHPEEGGFYVETYRSTDEIHPDALPNRYAGKRMFGTGIYYLLTPDTFSAMHRLQSDEIFHFYLGDPVEMLRLHPDGSGEIVRLGTDLQRGEKPQVVVPRRVWQGSLLAPGGEFALLGATVAPGFEFEDYEGGTQEDLCGRYPDFADRIAALTP